MTLTSTIINNSSHNTITRTSIQLYRDCLRLIRHVAPGTSNAKGNALRASVRLQFRAQAHAQGDALEHAKAHAVRGLSNYLLHQAAQKDPRMQTRMHQFHQHQVRAAQDASVTSTLSPESTSTTNTNLPPHST
jgi:hypothetical protein